MKPPEPPDPPDALTDLGFLVLSDTPLTLFNKSPSQIPDLAYPLPAPTALTRDGVVLHVTTCPPPDPPPCINPPSDTFLAKNGVGGGSPVSTSDTFLAYGLLSPVIYMSLVGNIDWLSTRQLSVLLTLSLRFITLAGGIPMCLMLYGSTLMTLSSIYIALARSSAVCSPLTGYMPVVDIGSNIPSTFAAMALAMIRHSLLLWQLGLKGSFVLKMVLFQAEAKMFIISRFDGVNCLTSSTMEVLIPSLYCFVQECQTEDVFLCDCPVSETTVIEPLLYPPRMEWN
ncbi:unnamed protein product [Eruca vesicaria subsp. sativa]|uniref:Uncharacterized protein n=1 Tax=Eruca vesicaria subsp. sativa TaxID=29727 RepID=A0ABC8LNB3_ERUVS|nr:unnamed protein product [Eruca vesicaria subsp. sativa]